MRQIDTGKGSIPLITLIAIWSISAVTSLPGLAVSPILGKIDQLFPGTTQAEVQQLSTLPNLLIIPFVLLSGKLAASKNKVLILALGLAIFLGCGLLYLFADSMRELIILSSALGIGAGMVVPLSTGLIAYFFVGKQRQQQLGFSSAINNTTLVLATLITGWLADIDWHWAFLVYLVAALPLLLSPFLREKEEKAPTPAAGQPEEYPDRLHAADPIHYRPLLGIMIFYFMITYVNLVVVLNLPFLMQQYGLDSSNAGLLISIFFLALTTPGYFINRVITAMGDYTSFISMACITGGLVVILLFHNEVMIGLGCVLVGFGYGVLQPIMYDKTSELSPASKVTWALALTMTMNYLSIVVYPFIVEGFQAVFQQPASNQHFPFLVNAIISALMTVLALLARKGFVLGRKPFIPEVKSPI